MGRRSLNLIVAVLVMFLFSQTAAWALPPRVEWEYSEPENKIHPGMITATPEGNILVTRNGFEKPSVIELDQKGEVVWEYGPIQANSAVRLQNGNTLIADSGSPGYPFQPRLIEVNPQGELIWSYTWESRADAPRFANRLSSGNVLAVLPGKVVEITSQGKTAWQYGQDLIYPVYAERLKNGATLIVDQGLYGGKVIEVSAQGRIAWQFGETSYSEEPQKLIKPVYAKRLADGSTLIADRGAAGLLQAAGQESKQVEGWKDVLKSLPVLNQWTAIPSAGSHLYLGLTLTSGRSVVWKVDEGIKTYLNGQWYEAQNQPVLIDKEVFVPAREFLAFCGAEVAWDNDLKQLTVTRGEKTAVITMDSREVLLNGKPLTLPVAPQIYGGTAMVPLQFIEEHFGLEFEWDGEKKELGIKQ